MFLGTKYILYKEKQDNCSFALGFPVPWRWPLPGFFIQTWCPVPKEAPCCSWSCWNEKVIILTNEIQEANETKLLGMVIVYKKQNTYLGKLNYLNLLLAIQVPWLTEVRGRKNTFKNVRSPREIKRHEKTFFSAHSPRGASHVLLPGVAARLSASSSVFLPT